ncbi:MAG: AAA family ATPase, partial [Cetobacterium sp.]
MKIQNIRMKNHEVLKNLDVDFLDKDGKVQNLVVIAGSNGSGKTNLLEAIYNYFLNKNNIQALDGAEIEILNEEEDLKKLPKVIYMPTEINFSEVK